MKFHISKKGLPAICKAQSGCCPLGDNNTHFNTREEAETFINNKSKSEFGILGKANSSQLENLNEKLKGMFTPENLEILDRLNKAGFKSYFVGGSLRDAVIDLPINDVDITTSATPEEVIEVFSDHTTLPIGIEHGTVVVMFGDEPFEITTFREDGEYSDSRRPDDVTFTTSLEDDVKRRDFTINSIAYNPEEGIVDFAGGIEDINNKIIKTVGNPDERFKEDPLRIMRGLRFASKLNFSIDKETEESIFRNKELLKNISVERLQKEFNGLLKGENSKEILVKYSAVISEFIPEIKPMIGFEQNNPKHEYDVWEHSATVVENTEDNLEHRLAAVFHDAGKPLTYSIDEKGVGHFLGHAEESVRIAETAMIRLKYPTKVKDKVLELIEDHDAQLSTKPYKIAKKIYEQGPERFLDSIKFMRADDKGKKNPDSRNAMFTEIEKKAKEYLSGSPILSHKDLDITAKDIMELGFKGADIGKALHTLSLMSISGQPNQKEVQIKYLLKNGVEQL